MGPISKQDVQSMLNTAQNRILERVALRQDVQALTDVVKNLLNLNQQNQQLFRQSEYQRLQLVRRAVALEARMGQLEAELRAMRTTVSATMTRMTDQQSVPQRMNMPATPESQQSSMPAQYLYRPAE
jgi:hypothetical protein